VLGETEITYLASLDREGAQHGDSDVSVLRPAVRNHHEGQEAPEELLVLARDKGIPVIARG